MIKLQSVSKKFKVGFNRNSFFGFLTNIFQKKEELVALNNISIDLDQREVVGLIGMNGAGKTTLLKIISKIVKPTEGNVNVEGKVVYISGFYTGLNRNLSLRDNIYVVGTINGLSRGEIFERIEKILDFTELADFLDMPMHKFSNGMMMRAAFSINIFTLPESPDILLLDEVFGGGMDGFFKEKADKKIDEYIKSAKITIISSHNMKYILDHCSKSIFMENGEIRALGDSAEIVEKYLNCNNSSKTLG